MNMYNQTLKELCNEVKWELSYESVAISKATSIYHNLRLKDYKPCDLRLMIEQKVGLEFLLELAIEELNSNILIKADLYPGDLLKVVSSVGNEYWKSFPHLYKDLKMMVDKSKNAIEEAAKVINEIKLS